MQKAEPQHNHTQNQPAQRQGGASLESPQGEQIAQLEAMIASSPQAAKQRDMAAMMNASPAMAAQRKMFGMIHNSPGQAAQRKFAEGINNSAVMAAQRRKFDAIQRVEEEEPLQGKSAAESPAQLEQQPAAKPNASTQLSTGSKPNHTGLPDNLKSGIENLSGMSMDNVKVHYNSSQPAQLNARAYAQGTDIHVAPGQEQHLPHEAWHVVQQAQGRVRPTMQMKGEAINDDAGLEAEADVMGGIAERHLKSRCLSSVCNKSGCLPIQRFKVIELGNYVDGVYSQVEHTSGFFKLKGTEEVADVGEKMEATLHPESPIKGSPVGNQWKWMDKLKERASVKVIRGHLLNHDLGGEALPYNLYPISDGANKEHSWKVEQNVKRMLYGASSEKKAEQGQKDPRFRVKYAVEVVGRDDEGMKATFACSWWREDVERVDDGEFTWTGPVGDKRTENIVSDLGGEHKNVAYPPRENGKEVKKVVVPDAWKKGDKEAIKPGSYQARPGEHGMMVVPIEEGSEYKPTPNWKRALGQDEKYKSSIEKIEQWSETQQACASKRDINRVLNEAVRTLVHSGEAETKALRSKGPLRDVPSRECAVREMLEAASRTIADQAKQKASVGGGNDRRVEPPDLDHLTHAEVKRGEDALATDDMQLGEDAELASKSKKLKLVCASWYGLYSGWKGWEEHPYKVRMARTVWPSPPVEESKGADSIDSSSSLTSSSSPSYSSSFSEQKRSDSTGSSFPSPFSLSSTSTSRTQRPDDPLTFTSTTPPIPSPNPKKRKTPVPEEESVERPHKKHKTEEQSPSMSSDDQQLLPAPTDRSSIRSDTANLTFELPSLLGPNRPIPTPSPFPPQFQPRKL